MRIKDLATRATKLLTGNAYMVFDNGTKVEKVDYAELAKQIITEYNTQTLAGSAQSVKSALDALNSKTIKNNATILNNTHDLNDYKGVDKAGFYYLQEGVANAPTSWVWMEVINGSGTIQVCYSATRCWQRAYTGNPLAWTEWATMPGRDEITALNSKTGNGASFPFIANGANAADYDDLPVGLVYNQGVGEHCPDSNGYYLVLTFKARSEYENSKCQLAFSFFTSGVVKYRAQTSGTWKAWVTL